MNAELITHMGDDLMVANVARVSMDKHHAEFEDSDARLIHYLAKHNHITPFFHPQVQIRLKAPIFVARQWFRSVIGVGRNEVSRRYVDTPPEFYVPEVWRARPEGNIKQGSGGALDVEEQLVISDLYEEFLARAEQDYKMMLRLGVAPEQARMVLPQSMYTTWIETGSLAYWARIYTLRIDPHAQQESQVLARQVGEVIAPLFPVSWAALVATPVAVE